MKTYLFIFFIFISSQINAQEFKFYLAFEDADNSKDTAWFVWDNTTTFQIDSTFGENPQILPDDKFQVFFKFYPLDTVPYYTKVYSAPSSSKTFTAKLNTNMDGPFKPLFKLPLKLSWDTTLLYNNKLPFEIKLAGIYSSAILDFDSIPNNTYFDLFTQNSTIISFDGDSSIYYVCFPIRVFFSAWSLGFEDLTSNKIIKNVKNVKNYEKIKLIVNEKKIFINNEIYDNAKIYDISGFLIKEFLNPISIININFIKKGIYKLVLENKDKFFYEYIKVE